MPALHDPQNWRYDVANLAAPEPVEDAPEANYGPLRTIEAWRVTRVGLAGHTMARRVRVFISTMPQGIALDRWEPSITTNQKAGK